MRDRERGAVLMVVLITLVGLLAIGGLAVLSVRSELTSVGHVRFQQTALYAAESGVAAGVEYLRTRCDPDGGLFSEHLRPGSEDPVSPTEIPGNGAAPGDERNLFSRESGAWYEVAVLNNVTDPGLAEGKDTDGVVVLRVVGHGPDRTRTTLLVEVEAEACDPVPCPSVALGAGGKTAATACGGRVAGPLRIRGWHEVL